MSTRPSMLWSTRKACLPPAQVPNRSHLPGPAEMMNIVFVPSYAYRLLSAPRSKQSVLAAWGRPQVVIIRMRVARLQRLSAGHFSKLVLLLCMEGEPTWT